METRIFAAVFVVLSLVFLFVMVPGLQSASTANPMFQTSGLGPAAIPYFAGAAVLVLAVAMFFERPTTAPRDAAAAEPGAGVSVRNLGLAVAILAGFLVLMPLLGFMVAGVLFLAAFFVAFRAPSLPVAASVAILAPVAVDLLLRKVFLIPLPQFGWF